MTKLTIKTTYHNKLVEKYMIDHYFIKLKKVRWIVNGISLFIIITYICLYNNFSNWLTNIELLITLIIIIVLIEFNTKILPKRSFKKISISDKFLLNTVNTYTLDENSIEITNEQGSTKLKYLQLYCCIEVKNAYYIYINDRQALIIDKDTISTKTNDQLSKILRDKIKNYQIIKR